MHPKNSTPNFNYEKAFGNKNQTVNRTTTNFSVYDDYQYTKTTPQYEQQDVMFHSQLFNANDNLKKQIVDLQRQVKMKELSCDQMTSALYQSQLKIDELYSQLQIIEQEKVKLKKEIVDLNERNDFKSFDMKQQQEINSLFQTENTKLKIEVVKLKDTILKLQVDNRQLKDQIEMLMTNPQTCERKGSSRQSFDCWLSEPDQSQQNGSMISPCEKQCGKRICYLQNEIKKYQTQIQEKDQLISKMSLQNSDLQKSQLKFAKCKKQSKLFGTPETENGKNNPILVKDESNDNSRQINSYLSDKKFEINTPQDKQQNLQTTSSARSILVDKSKKEVGQIYRKMNQSALYTASLFSTMLDYKVLHQDYTTKLNQNQIKQL